MGRETRSDAVIGDPVSVRPALLGTTPRLHYHLGLQDVHGLVVEVGQRQRHVPVCSSVSDRGWPAGGVGASLVVA